MFRLLPGLTGALLASSLPLAAQAQLVPARVVVVDRGAQDPAVSPDGKTVAVGILGMIWRVPIEGSSAKQLSFGSGWHSRPAWSPDGRFLAYAHQRLNGTELVVQALATGVERTIHITKASLGQITYHPSRSEIFFIDDRDMFAAHLWSVPTSTYYLQYGGGFGDPDKRSGGDPKQLTFGDKQGERSFAFSPDGQWIALEHVNAPYPSVRDVHVMDLHSTTVDRLTDTPQNDESSVNWTRDGASLIYIDLEEGMEHVTIRSLRDGTTRRIFSSVYDGKQLVLHPDGKTAVMVAGRRLFRLDLSSGRVTQIPFEARFRLPGLAPADLLVTNARLFDGKDDQVTEGTNVAVRDGRIVQVWRGAVPAASASAVQLIDAQGRFLMPGLMDNHYHYWNYWPFYGADLLAMGITSIRDPGAPIADSLNLRDAIAYDLLAGPHLYTLGPLLDGYGWKRTVDIPLSRPEAAAAMVRALHQQGVDGVKLYFSLAPEVAAAAIAQARALGLPVTGDLYSTTWRQAIDAGIDGLNHSSNYNRGFLPASLRLPWREGPEALWANKSMASRFRVDPRGTQVQALLRDMAARGVMLDPTLTNLKEDAALVQGGLDHLSAGRLRSEDVKTLTLEAYRAGVTLLAGTDGHSLHDELEIYEHLGLPNAVILKMATVNGARWLRKDREFGTIEIGKRADLLLIDGDPLRQMKDIRNVALVVKDGRIVFEK